MKIFEQQSIPRLLKITQSQLYPLIFSLLRVSFLSPLHLQNKMLLFYPLNRFVPCFFITGIPMSNLSHLSSTSVFADSVMIISYCCNLFLDMAAAPPASYHHRIQCNNEGEILMQVTTDDLFVLFLSFLFVPSFILLSVTHLTH